jgi:hypothetical protein
VDAHHTGYSGYMKLMAAAHLDCIHQVSVADIHLDPVSDTDHTAEVHHRDAGPQEEVRHTHPEGAHRVNRSLAGVRVAVGQMVVVRMAARMAAAAGRHMVEVGRHTVAEGHRTAVAERHRVKVQHRRVGPPRAEWVWIWLLRLCCHTVGR